MDKFDRLTGIAARIGADPLVAEYARRRSAERKFLEEARSQSLFVSKMTTPLSAEVSPMANSRTTAVSGRLLCADAVNLNGQLFEVPDMEYGLPSLVSAPLTYNHEDNRGAYGWISTASVEDHPDHGRHIVIGGQVWTDRFDNIGSSLRSSIANGTAALSMECVPSEVQCLNCGRSARSRQQACDHLATSSTSPRRMVNPTFYGAALILDGVKPAWRGSSLGYGK